MADMDNLNAFKQNQEKKEIDANRKLKVGIIGTGWIAGTHMRQYVQMPDVEIVAGADLIPGKAEEFFKKLDMPNVRCYPDHKSMIDNEELDAVSVCTYNRTHAECTIYALEHGVNVLLEKPMSVTLDEAVEIVRAEKKSGKLLSIGFQPRFAPNMQMIKKIVQSGVLGDVYYMQTGGGRRSGIPTPFGTSFIEDKTAGVGALGDIGCYALDMVLNAVGYPKPLTVSGYTSAHFGTDPNYYATHPEYAEKFEVDDFGAGFIRLEGGIILDFRIAWAMNLDTTGDTLIMGTKGSLRIPSTECWNGEDFDRPMKIYHKVAGREVETEIPLIKDANFEGCFYHKVRVFLDAIKNGDPSPVPSSEIIYNQAIIDGIVKSNKLGREIAIEIPEI